MDKYRVRTFINTTDGTLYIIQKRKWFLFWKDHTRDFHFEGGKMKTNYVFIRKSEAQAVCDELNKYR